MFPPHYMPYQNCCYGIRGPLQTFLLVPQSRYQNPDYSSKRNGPYRAAPVGYFILFTGSIRHYSPSHGRLNEPAAGAALRESHPSGQRVQADGIIAKQLARAAYGWVGTAGHLIWPSFMRDHPHRWSWRTRRIAFPLRQWAVNRRYSSPDITV